MHYTTTVFIISVVITSIRFLTLSYTSLFDDNLSSVNFCQKLIYNVCRVGEKYRSRTMKHDEEDHLPQTTGSVSSEKHRVKSMKICIDAGYKLYKRNKMAECTRKTFISRAICSQIVAFCWELTMITHPQPPSRKCNKTVGSLTVRGGRR